METSKQEKSEESRSSSDSEKPANVSSRMWEVICLLLLSQHPASMPGIDNTQVYQMLKKSIALWLLQKFQLLKEKRQNISRKSRERKMKALKQQKDDRKEEGTQTSSNKFNNNSTCTIGLN